MHIVAIICFIIATILYIFGSYGHSELTGLAVIVEIIAWVVDYITRINKDDNMD
jgi:hypothetical protein